MKLDFQDVMGWAGAYSGRSAILYPRNLNHFLEIIDFADTNKFQISGVGSRNSMADSVVNNNNLLVSSSKFNKIIKFDPQNGMLIAQSGITIREILYKTLPFGWIPKSIPGTLNATIGGCISNNVHGKDSHRNGNFGNHVLWLDILLASGEVIRTSFAENIELFLATVGGIGLTGFILEAAIQLEYIESPNLDCLNIPSKRIEETYNNIISSDNFSYAQVWLDATYSLGNCGRGITMLSKFQKTEDFDFKNINFGSTLEHKSKFFGIVPTNKFWRYSSRFFYPPFIEIVNSIYWHKGKLASGSGKKESIPFHKYYFFHNVIGDFYSVYKPPGFLEMQIFIPQVDGLRCTKLLLSNIKKLGLVSVLSGMKKMKVDDFYISFSGMGSSISFDFPVKHYGISELTNLMQPLYRLVKDFGGKINLAKDQAMNSEIFEECYPNHSRFMEIKMKYDPKLLFSNDMSRRLFSKL